MSLDPWKQATVAARDMARRAMRQSPCPWIDLAIAEGWSKTLEDLFFSALREGLRKSPSDLPPMRWFEGFPISKEDHKHFRNHGQQHLAFELEEIKAERAELPRRDPRKFFGEAAE